MIGLLCRFTFLLAFELIGTAYVNAKDIPLSNKWLFIKSSGYQKLHTANMHAIEFGLLCDTRCMFYITNPPICQKKVLVSGWLIERTGVGSRIMAKCFTEDGVSFLAIDDYQKVMRIAKANTEIHFLMNWGVERNSLMTFNMNGFNESLKKFNPRSLLD